MISIIVPCYNCEKIVFDLISSLDAQKSKNFEVVFVDDCSTDNTYETLKNLENTKAYSLIVKQNRVNQGPGNTRNYGISIANGDYITFADSDDFFCESAIGELERAIIENNSPDAVLYDYFYVKNKKKVKKSTISCIKCSVPSIDEAILYSSSSPWGKMYKKSIIMSNNISFPNFKLKEDFVFNKLALSNCERIYYLQSPLYYYRYVKTSIMNSYNVRKSPSVSGKAFDILQKYTPADKRNIFLLLSIRHYLFLKVQYLIITKISNTDINTFIDEYTELNPCWKQNYRNLKYEKYFYLIMWLIEKRKIGLLRIIFHIKYIVKGLI